MHCCHAYDCLQPALDLAIELHPPTVMESRFLHVGSDSAHIRSSPAEFSRAHDRAPCISPVHERISQAISHARMATVSDSNLESTRVE